MAAAYAVVAWLALQVVNNVAPVLVLPPWIARAILLLLVLGFPLALLFAWIQQVARVPTDGGTLQALPESTLGNAPFHKRDLPKQTPSQGMRSVLDALRPAPISIAVLPLANMSGDPAQEFFSDGMTEEITAALAKVPDLRVVARTSAFEFKSRESRHQECCCSTARDASD